MSKDSGGQAFPVCGTYTLPSNGMLTCDFIPGMTLRQYYAAKAMQKFIEKYFPADNPFVSVPDGIYEAISHKSFEMSDFMLAHEQNEKEEKDEHE